MFSPMVSPSGGGAVLDRGECETVSVAGEALVRTELYLRQVARRRHEGYGPGALVQLGGRRRARSSHLVVSVARKVI